MTASNEPQVCTWASKYPEDRQYHDSEWGVPVLDDQVLFEFICLEGAQAGLSWRTILLKRDAYRAAFADFDIETLAKVDTPPVEAIIDEFAIVKNKLKIKSVYTNAKAAQALQREYGSLAKALWQFVDFNPKQNHISAPEQVPAVTPESIAMSKFLKKKGFKFVGETICYALMQATGMVNDHQESCPQQKVCAAKADGVREFFNS
ncbi:MAG: DNA-3-methyladenine glycosylase I [Vibrio sp.]